MLQEPLQHGSTGHAPFDINKSTMSMYPHFTAIYKAVSSPFDFHFKMSSLEENGFRTVLEYLIISSTAA